MARVILLATGGVLSAVGIWVLLFTAGIVTLGGVPYRVLLKVWQDETARSALLGGESTALHDQMSDLGIEREIKAHYRERIQDPVELDRYIHQVLYDRTGYVGANYKVEGRKLVLKDPGLAEEIRSCPTC
ncbi:MAG: hypothetical protein AAFQ89_23505 [Cyanobacteria bacterium J06626_18]